MVTDECLCCFYIHRSWLKIQAVAAKFTSGRSKIYKRSQQKLRPVALNTCYFGSDVKIREKRLVTRPFVCNVQTHKCLVMRM